MSRHERRPRADAAKAAEPVRVEVPGQLPLPLDGLDVPVSTTRPAGGWTK